MESDDELLWWMESDEHPVVCYCLSKEGIVVRIEERRLVFETWTDLKKKLKDVKDGNVDWSNPYQEMSDESKAVIDFLYQVVETQDEYMSLMEGLSVRIKESRS